MSSEDAHPHVGDRTRHSLAELLISCDDLDFSVEGDGHDRALRIAPVDAARLAARLMDQVAEAMAQQYEIQPPGAAKVATLRPIPSPLDLAKTPSRHRTPGSDQAQGKHHDDDAHAPSPLDLMKALEESIRPRDGHLPPSANSGDAHQPTTALGDERPNPFNKASHPVLVRSPQRSAAHDGAQRYATIESGGELTFRRTDHIVPPENLYRGFEILPGAREYADRCGFTLDQVVEAACEPDEEWLSDRGSADYRLKGDVCAVVAHDTGSILSVYSRSRALRDQARAESTGVQVVRRSYSGGPGNRYPTTNSDLIARLRRAGFDVSWGKGHPKVTHPDHPGESMPFPLTPSDARGMRNTVTDLNRIFGVDLRDV
ncbi:hypothetical protein [Devriesea agamarum]|uniref:hypothetical protein n=1 Tax=Devriesea agamarum TaxID=472569 RepID=UPI00071E5370|nr:hypothetical protein [Devriesea agamarum]